jgi:predicted nucleic acid-binding protein
MPVVRTFLDSGVLMAAFKGETADGEKAMALLDDPNREFIGSTFLKLEVIPQPAYNKRPEEVEFFKEFFLSAVEHYAESTEALANAALSLAEKYGLLGMDALHASAAQQFDAAEFVTTEKPTRPLHRIRELKVTHLKDCPALGR